jgi:hypothetical protein
MAVAAWPQHVVAGRVRGGEASFRERTPRELFDQEEHTRLRGGESAHSGWQRGRAKPYSKRRIGLRPGRGS